MTAAVTRHRRWRLSTRILVSQLWVLLVVATLGLWLNLRLATEQLDQQYEHRSLAVAQSVADLPQVVAALSGTGPHSSVQPLTQRIAGTTGAAFVVVVDRRGIRLSSPDAALVGTWFHEPVVALDGQDHLRIDPGKPAPSANARAPVFSSGGAVIGEVSVGFRESDVAAAVGGEIPLLAGAAGIALLLGLATALVLARRLKQDTFGLELDEIAAMLDKAQLIAVGRESLRRVTALVAQGVPTAEVFAAVAEETGRLTRAEETRVYRYEGDGSLVRVAAWGESAAVPRQVMSVPIVVDGRRWGLVAVTMPPSAPVPEDLGMSIAGFAGVAATAISNALARDELAASRKRVVAAADEARRKIERDLHDGTQQRLVTLALELRKAYDVCPGPPQLRDALFQMTKDLASMLEELRDISRGVHPALLSQAGLGPAVRSLARRPALPVRLRVGVPGRLPESLEVAAYYVVSEALANATKHSGATAVEVDVAVRDGTLAVRVSDDGTGGVDETRGSGILGLRDRVEALGGTMAVASPRGGGTVIHADLPVGAPGRDASSVT
jgi:signal transduction histidine kinase